MVGNIRKKKNNKPEDLIVRPQIKLLCLQFGIDVYDIQASNYDPYRKTLTRYHHVPPGFPDLCGIGPEGIAVFIELKAPKRRSNLSELQRYFLTNAIKRKAFACVTDSMEHFSNIWYKWKEAKSIQLLLDDLP